MKMIIIRNLALSALGFICMCIAAQGQSSNQNEAKIEHLIKQMTLEEKIGMIHANSSFTSAGVPRLRIPELTMSDGPHGVRPEHGRDWELDNKGGDSSTYLPVGITLASTWNPALGYAFGAVLGSEAAYRGKDVILGPGINIMRTPLNGRNFEYLGEDPYLISKMATGYIKGVQDQGVSACVKHYLANNQEFLRGEINVEMSERALREIYLPGFKAAVMEGGVNTLMGAYNKFRGEYCTYNNYLINKILKQEWKFKGAVISDWGAIHSTKEALLGGADLEMGTDLSMLPNPDYNKFFFANDALKMVRSGEVAESVIDDKVRRILRVMFKTQMFDKRKAGAHSIAEHAAVAKKVAEEGIILLRNNKGVLPLNKQAVKTIAVIGANANRENAMGGGSSQVRAPYEITPLKGLQNYAGNHINILFEQGYTIAKGAKPDAAHIKKAVEAAKRSDVAIIVGGWTHGYDYSVWDDNAYDAEGRDKPDMNLPFGQDQLIKAVAGANPNTVVVLYGGGPADMTQWVDKVKGIIQAGYPGQEGGNALAAIIFGEVNPSGRLTVTFPKKLADVPAHKLGEYPGDSINVHYNDDIFVGYRYYDTYNVEPLFPFGHGLSYTAFKYSNLSATIQNGKATVTVRIQNTGSRPGAEVVQLYVKDVQSSVKRPDKELKAFEKTFLLPGQSKDISFELGSEAFSFFDDGKMQWVKEPGEFEILVGSSSRDIRARRTIKL